MADIQNLYFQFINLFPVGLQPIVSIALAVFIIYSVVQVVKRNFIYLILLVVLLPGSVPILKSIWEGVLTLIKFLFARQ